MSDTRDTWPGGEEPSWAPDGRPEAVDARASAGHNEGMQTLEFENGDRMPALGLGTWKASPGEVGAAVREALRLGYRHFDCATIYGNQAEIGAALADCLAEGRVRREQLWITSKLWNDRHRERDVRPALEETLADLRLEYLDLYLIHWPVAQRKGVLGPTCAADFLTLEEVPLAETWRGLEAAHEAGLCRHIGVSNFSVAKLAHLTERARLRPELNQIELHPYLQQPDVVAWCRVHDVAVTAYSPLGSGDRSAELKAPDEPDLLADPRVTAIAARRGCTPAQVLLAWALGRGTAVIPKSVNPARLAQNLAATEVALTPGDQRELADLDLGRRHVTGAFWVFEGGPYTLANLWD